MSVVQIPDLIPDDFGATKETPPVRFLRVQQDSLPRKTNGVVEAFIRTRNAQDGFIHDFFLSVPSLEDYTYHLLRLEHPITYYPLKVVFLPKNQLVDCADEVQFIRALTVFFSSDEFKFLISALIAQVKESK